MNKQAIPEVFKNLASEYGLSTELAEELYVRRVNNMNTDEMAFRAVKDGCYKDLFEARKQMNNIWRQWRSFVTTGQMSTAEGELYATPQSTELHKHSYVNKQTALERAYAGLEEVIGPCNKISGPAVKEYKDEDAILVCGDFHFPFVHQRTFAKVLSHPAKDIIITGDYLDMYANQSFRPSIDYVTCTEELAVGRASLEMIAAKFDNVYMIAGNHDKRALKKIQGLAPQTLPLLQNPLRVISYGLENVQILNLTIPNTAPVAAYGSDIVLDFAGMYDDLLISHFEEFCGDDAPKKVEDFIQRFSHELPIENPRAILQGHVHRLGMSFTPKGRLLVTTGCACLTQEYVFVNHSKYQPPTQGFVVLYRDQFGKIDLEKTQLIPTGGY